MPTPQTGSHQSVNHPCNVHEHHDHQHGEGCGHKAVKHGDHVDYEHDGHRHRVHGKHVDECVAPRVASTPGVAGARRS